MATVSPGTTWAASRRRLPAASVAMAYLNLLYRRKADAVASPSERDDLLLMADYLLDRVKEIKWKRAEQPRQP